METQNWLIKQAQTQPAKLAVDDGHIQLTFSQLLTRVQQLVGQLAALKPGARVGILGNNSLATYELALAVLSSGRTIVWLNWRLADEELMRQIKDSGLKVCLVADQLWRDKFDQQFINYHDFLRIPPVTAPLVSTLNYDQVASIMYTSGTTGRPKGVLQTIGNHFYSAVASVLNLGLNPQDEWLCVAPLFHISGFSIMLRGLIYGITVRLVEKFRPEKVAEILVHEPVTIMSVVPFMLKKLLAEQQRTGQRYQASFRCMLLGGGTIDRASLQACQEAGIPVVQCYGMTETCSQVVALRAQDAWDKLGSVGQPLFTTQLKLGTHGEVMLKTPALTPGYLNLPDKLPGKLIDGWYQTGDIGHLDDDGYLYIDGRQDEMLISGGENIFPQEVEQVYQRYPGIDDVAVVGQPDSVWGAVPVAFIVGKKTASAKLIDYGYQHLAHYKVPQRYLWVNQLPKNASGKLQRYLLRQYLK